MGDRRPRIVPLLILILCIASALAAVAAYVVRHRADRDAAERDRAAEESVPAPGRALP